MTASVTKIARKRIWLTILVVALVLGILIYISIDRYRVRRSVELAMSRVPRSEPQGDDDHAGNLPARWP